MTARASEPSLCLACGVNDAHTYPAKAEPGIYLDRGHAVITDDHRALTITDLGAAYDLGGITITDPKILDQLADYASQAAQRLRDHTKEGTATA